MAEGQLSFRWGIPWLDQGYLQVPNFFFEHYLTVGLTRPEFLFVLHLARYKYESGWGVARPSLAKVAGEMGYGKRQVQRIVKSLEDKRWLVVRERPGKPSEYNFEALARALFRLWEGGDRNVTGDMGVTGRGDMGVTGRGDMGDTRRIRTEEEEIEEKEGPPDIQVTVDAEAVLRLVEVGYQMDHAKGMVKLGGGKRVLELVAEAEEGGHLGGMGDWIRRQLRAEAEWPKDAHEGG